MDQYPTEEDEFELVYGDDLDAMDDVDSEPALPKSTPSVLGTPSNSNEQRPGRAPSACSNYRTPGQLGTIDESPLASPALSQITRGSSTAHKRLFDTPGPSTSNGGYKRAASTPFPGASSSGENALQMLQRIDANPRKRRLEALFGDIQDIEEEPYEDYEYVSQKKSKTEEEQDMELIDRILEARRRFNTVANPAKPSMLSRAEELHRFKMNNMSYEPPNWPSMTIRRNDQVVYVRFHSEEFEKMQLEEVNCMKNGYNGLLGAEKERIWREANEIVAKRLTEPANAITQPPPEVEEIVIPSENSALWVEKYRPRRYVDLLSDESTNRSLLQWLKLWDKVVFRREPKKTRETKQHPQQFNSFNKRTGRFESNGGWVKGGGRKAKSTLNTELDENGCPVQKVALLCGPPGLGKTTLAHTIARHAGYAVREVNASDDRSPDAFRLVLENGTQMKSVLNEENRPNCIVMDEIDGAPVAAIEFLLRFIAGGTGQKVGGKKGSGKTGRDKSVLKRPIICICNDMYAPALRQLRLVSFVVNFPPTECCRLAERLLTIAKREDVTTDLTSMLALAEKTGNDVRSCLSMLQFFACAKKPIRLTDVLKCNVGQKDRQKGLFSIWSSIFQIQRPKKTITVDLNSTVAEIVSLTDMSAATRMSNVLGVITMAGDYERLMQGVYENYLHQKMPDPDMCGVAEATEWFCFNDRVQRTLHQLQNYAIYPYLSYAFVMWHYLFATLAWPKINFPSKGYEHSQKLASTKLIMTGLRKGLSAQLKGIGEGSRVLIETIPMLKRVINPSMRSVSLQLLTQKEKTDLTHTVEVMADFGLNYIQLKTAEGTYQYQLNPDLDQLCHFGGASVQSSSYFGKQIVAREVELEQMRRAQPKVMGTDNADGAGSNARQPSAKNNNRLKENAAPGGLFGKGKSKGGPKTSSELPNHLRTLKPKQILQKTKQVVSKDFFGRICTTETALSVKEGGSDAIVKSPIWYRYKEGFNNAVRKDVTLQDLM